MLWLQSHGFRLIPKTKEDAVGVCDQINQFISKFQENVSSQEFKLRNRRVRRAALKNFNGMKNYVRDLFKLRSRLLVVRVDLSYPSEFVNAEESGREVGVEKVVADRRLFLKELYRRGFSENLIGYCWKLEYALRKGFHYHCMFFFDGAKVREGVTLGRLIGRVWEDVTGHQQVYWNCNAAEDKYEFPGIGMISHNDHLRLIGVERTIAYLTKPDYCLSLSKQSVGDSFGRGKIKIRKNKVGRPRSDKTIVS